MNNRMSLIVLSFLFGACATTPPEKIPLSSPLGQIGPVPVSAFARFYAEAHKRLAGREFVVAVSPLFAGRAYDEPEPPLEVSCVWNGGELQSYSIDTPEGPKPVGVKTSRVEQVFRIDGSLRLHPANEWAAHQDNIRTTFVSPLCSNSRRIALLILSDTRPGWGDAAGELMVVELREGRWELSSLHYWSAECEGSWSTRVRIAPSSSDAPGGRVHVQAPSEG